MTTAPRAQEILAYWLGPEAERDHPAASVSERWWRKDPALDAEIARLFGADVERAGQGGFDAWCADPRGRLAIVILLDQFTRNIHRDSGEMYRHDARALRTALDGLELGHDRELRATERQFLLMPLMHAEEVGVQRRAEALFDALAAQTELDVTEFARAHREIVERFGRFPHRNALLGRPSRPEELAFLAEPGSSF